VLEIRHHVNNTYGEVEIYPHGFLS